MAQSLSKVLLHVVYSTKDRAPWLSDPVVRKDLYAYMASIMNAMDCPALLINGVADHVHTLCQLSRKVAICDLLEEIKKQPSKWLKTQGTSYQGFHWQAGYGVFSVSESKGEDVKAYIQNQEEHHRKVSFQDEFRRLCEKHAVPLDERYAWD
ncbi:REP element-mobilizing transposase RayT [Roseimicrobium gellanilyticum]|uniref:REP element-mobilizing transposase RayT n=1 Tax=Roseimicrobium gellanilyticum TaxID=748857 RepID=A0A366H0Y0_9BACT|nr:transposase [Roseimicrobium gellanilyticum]RBP35517.1 REP element-mobilizing transposase RayT [Roseimicrobium gellanilyticum]